MVEVAEKLIEELDTLMIRELYTGVSTWDELDEEDKATVVGAWLKAITRIGEAYADGMPLPGEVERITFRGAASLNLARGDILIILRKEGTGKDEEND